MRNLRSARLMKLKALLFVLAGMLAVALLLMEAPSLRTAFLLAVTIWCFCRAYYFAFYVLERYVDPGLRFSGLIGLARCWMARR